MKLQWFLLYLLAGLVDSFQIQVATAPSVRTSIVSTPVTRTKPLRSSKQSDDDKSIPSELKSLPKIPKDDKTMGGISIKLDPMTAEEANRLKVAAVEIVHEKIAAGVDHIESLRQTLKEELSERQSIAAQKSAAKAQLEGDRLLNKIDQMTSTFLASTHDSRTQTKRLATVDQQSVGKGVELGSWGMLGDAQVNIQSSSLSGSQKKQGPSGVLILADSSSDPYAKRLIDPLLVLLKKILQSDNLPVTIHKPTATVPLGGNSAAAIVIFLTSYSDVSTVQNALDRALRKTIDGAIPTQIVAISTVGTERTEKMPYSMQNLIGRKLDQRRQMEEAVIQIVKQKDFPMDYTICKLGELDNTKAKSFCMKPGDAVDGALSIDTAAYIVSQAMVGHESARNSTFSVVGSNPTDAEVADAFLRLDGPELYREDELANCEALVQYVMEWSQALATSGKGLTTPVQSSVVPVVKAAPGVKAAAATKLLFLPTATGKNYVSREEERDRSKQLPTNYGSVATTTTTIPSSRIKQDGGLEFVVDQMTNGLGRVRVKRCNYGDGVVVKELSEETILSDFKKSMEVWRRSHPLS